MTNKKKIFLRPSKYKECNCGYFNNKIKSKNGFSSGHMNTVSFFSKNYINKDKYNPLKVLLISSMGWARYKKNVILFLKLLLVVFYQI